MTILYIVTSTNSPSCVLSGVVATATNMSIQGNLRVTKLKTKSLFHYNDLSPRKRVVLVFECFIFPNYDSITGKLLITTGTEVLGLSVRNIIVFLLIFSCVIFKKHYDVLYHNSKYHELLFQKPYCFY